MIGSRTLSGVDVAVHSETVDGIAEILTPAAVDFVCDLSRHFESKRRELLEARRARQREIDNGSRLDFSPATEDIRKSEWSIAPLPNALLDRRVEITGPAERKMMINALNSGSRVFMADFEDANSPTWSNVIAGQINIRDAVRGAIRYVAPNGKEYRLVEQPAVLIVRPRGWHLVEKHVSVDGQPVSASLFDAGLFLYHNARYLLDAGRGPYLYLPKLESRLEARLWNDVFQLAQDSLGIPRASVKATVLIETLPAAFEMDEILFELRDHSAGLNAGRWDYLFSIIKTLRNRQNFVFPDRDKLTMTVPFMRAYAKLLVATCHRRSAPAIGGMAAFIPSRTDAAINATALARVREDKEREAGDGFDGTWVAHPDLVPVAMEAFDAVLGTNPNQIRPNENDTNFGAAELLNFNIDGWVTDKGLRANISVALRYLTSWLAGNGAAAIDNLMEDVATAEIARAQIWQWIHHGAILADGRPVTRSLVENMESEVASALKETATGVGDTKSHLANARSIFKKVALDDAFIEFLTLPAYEYLP